MSGDRCIKHRKPFVGVCNWCGAHVCELCIADRNGNKLYCDKCVGQLSTIKRIKVPAVPQTRQDVPETEKRKGFEPYY